MVDDFQAHALKSRLRIPVLYGGDAVHGQSLCKGTTLFPHNIGLGAANDPELVEAIARATAAETACTGGWSVVCAWAIGRVGILIDHPSTTIYRIPINATPGVAWAFAPCVAVVGDCRWGRTYESFGEDTAKVAACGAAHIKGLQGGINSAGGKRVRRPRLR